MSGETTIIATDLEDFDEVDVVEVLVSVGDVIEKNQPIVTLESDKAMMEFPANQAGKVSKLQVSAGDKVRQGDPLITIQATDGDDKKTVGPETESPSHPEKGIRKSSSSDSERTRKQADAGTPNNTKLEPAEQEIIATGLEDFDLVDVVEVLVSEGEQIHENQPVVTLESDKATLDFPSPVTGTVKNIAVGAGDKVRQGDVLLILSVSESLEKRTEPPKDTEITGPSSEKPGIKTNFYQSRDVNFQTDTAYASPLVRKYAKDLGVDLEQVTGSATHSRILKEDVQTFIKNKLTLSNESGSNVTENELPDFSKYGPVEVQGLSKLKQISAQRLTHSWQTIPHVTQFDEANITELDSARKQINAELEPQGIKLTILPFILKALIKCLAEYPDFNSSVNQESNALIIKKYFNIGVAVDTPRGLIVPVIKGVDKKKIPQISKELIELSNRARDGKLTPKEMSGGCMSVSSIGGIGGHYFTPIINYPEVAILGVSRAEKKVVKVNDALVEKLMLPLSLSYDHRAIDGVAAVKFIIALKSFLSDPWSLML